VRADSRASDIDKPILNICHLEHKPRHQTLPHAEHSLRWGMDDNAHRIVAAYALRAWRHNS